MKTLNPKAEVMGRAGALYMTISASKGLLDVMKTNLGPKGTIKMLVGGAGGEWPSQPAASCPSSCTLAEQQRCMLWQLSMHVLLQTSSSPRMATCC